MLLALIIVSYLLFNLIVALFFITAPGDVFGFEELPIIFAMMICTPIPVFLFIQRRQARKKKRERKIK